MSGETALRVLVVDDSDDQRELLRTHFARAGCIVKTATDSVGAERLLAADAFDVAVLDLMFPGVNGWEIADHIREVAPSTSIVIASVIDRSNYPAADDVLPKPFTGTDVKKLVARLDSDRMAADR